MISFSDSLRTKRLQAIIDEIDDGSRLQIYSGVRPSTGSVAPMAILLAELTLNYPVATINNNVLTFNPISDDESANNTGDVSWGRIVTSTGEFVMDFDCGTAASSAGMKFFEEEIQLASEVRVNSFIIAEGNA